MRHGCDRAIHRDLAQEQETQAPGRSTSMNTLNPVIAQHIAAVNAFDTDAIVSTFAEDAFVNDVHREFWGMDAVRRWEAKEVGGGRVPIEARDLIDHSGDQVVRAGSAASYDTPKWPPGDIMLRNS